MRYPDKKGQLQVRRVLCSLRTTASILAPMGQLKCGLRYYGRGRVGKGADRPGSRLHNRLFRLWPYLGVNCLLICYVCDIILKGKSVAKRESLTISSYFSQQKQREGGERERELGVFKGEFPN